MAKFREEPCKYYVCANQPCEKNREAGHNGYCQRCGKYEPRARVRHINRKKQELEKIRRKEVY